MTMLTYRHSLLSFNLRVFLGKSKGHVCRLRKEVVSTEAAMTAAGRSGTTHVKLGISLSMFYLFLEHLNTLS